MRVVGFDIVLNSQMSQVRVIVFILSSYQMIYFCILIKKIYLSLFLWV